MRTIDLHDTHDTDGFKYPQTDNDREASIMADFMKLRRRGASMIDLVNKDLDAHEWICEMAMEEREREVRAQKLKAMDSMLSQLVQDYLIGVDEAEDDETILEYEPTQRIADFCAFLAQTVDCTATLVRDDTAQHPQSIRQSLEREGVAFPVKDFYIDPITDINRTTLTVLVKTEFGTKWRMYMIRLVTMEATLITDRYDPNDE